MCEVWPDALNDDTFTLIEDDGHSRAWVAGAVARTLMRLSGPTSDLRLVIGPVAGTCVGLPAERTWTIRVPGTTVISNDGRSLPASTADHSTSTTLVPIPVGKVLSLRIQAA